MMRTIAMTATQLIRKYKFQECSHDVLPRKNTDIAWWYHFYISFDRLSTSNQSTTASLTRMHWDERIRFRQKRSSKDLESAVFCERVLQKYLGPRLRFLQMTRRTTLIVLVQKQYLPLAKPRAQVSLLCYPQSF